MMLERINCIKEAAGDEGSPGCWGIHTSASSKNSSQASCLQTVTPTDRPNTAQGDQGTRYPLLSRVVLESEGQMVILKAFNLTECLLKGNKPSQKQNKHNFSLRTSRILAALSLTSSEFLSHSPQEAHVLHEVPAGVNFSERLPWFSPLGMLTMARCERRP